MEYKEYVEHEEMLRKTLKDNTLTKFEQVLVLSDKMNPTRNNILSTDLVRNKMRGWRQMNALQHVDENSKFVEGYLSSHAFKKFTNYGTPDRNHRYIKISINEGIEFLRDFKVANMPDALRKSSTIQYMRHLADNHKASHVYLFEMAFNVNEGRNRSLICDKGRLKINNIFSGRSTNINVKYPGDKEIKFDDALCIQVHRIRLKHESHEPIEWDNKLIYTLGLYYPENFAHAFVGIPS